MRPTTDLRRRVAPFEVVSDFQPSGDQPDAIDDLRKRFEAFINERSRGKDASKLRFVVE